MTAGRWWIAIAVLLATTAVMAKLPHGTVTELNQPLQTFPLEIVDWHGFDQPLTDRIPRAQHVRVVVKEEHPHDINAMGPLLELGQNHLAQLVAGRVTGGRKDVGNLH